MPSVEFPGFRERSTILISEMDKAIFHDYYNYESFCHYDDNNDDASFFHYDDNNDNDYLFHNDDNNYDDYFYTVFMMLSFIIHNSVCHDNDYDDQW